MCEMLDAEERLRTHISRITPAIPPSKETTARRRKRVRSQQRRRRSMDAVAAKNVGREGARERGSVIMRCFACPAFLPSLRSGSLARARRQACKEVRQAAGRPGMRRRGRGSICQPRKERDSRPLCPAMAAAAANYNFAWRRGSARGCVTELRATRGETRRREEKKEADGRTA